MIFRGFIPSYLSKPWPTWVPLVLTSSLFGALHLTANANVVEFAIYFALGALMYHCMTGRGNLKAAILLHIFNNLPIALFLGAQALMG